MPLSFRATAADSNMPAILASVAIRNEQKSCRVSPGPVDMAVNTQPPVIKEAIVDERLLWLTPN